MKLTLTFVLTIALTQAIAPARAQEANHWTEAQRDCPMCLMGGIYELTPTEKALMEKDREIMSEARSVQQELRSIQRQKILLEPNRIPSARTRELKAELADLKAEREDVLKDWTAEIVKNAPARQRKFMKMLDGNRTQQMESLSQWTERMKKEFPNGFGGIGDGFPGGGPVVGAGLGF
jgi:hypothetical protein